MNKDEIVAGLAEINAFCEVFIKEFNCDNEITKRWKEYTDEAIKLINNTPEYLYWAVAMKQIYLDDVPEKFRDDVEQLLKKNNVQDEYE